MNDRALTYNRRLQKAIHNQNNQLYPSGYNSIDRTHSGYGGSYNKPRATSKSGVPRQRVGYTHQSQPHQRMNQKVNYHSSYGSRNQNYNQNKYTNAALQSNNNINTNQEDRMRSEQVLKNNNDYGAQVNKGNLSFDENYITPSALQLIKKKQQQST